MTRWKILALAPLKEVVDEPDGCRAVAVDQRNLGIGEGSATAAVACDGAERSGMPTAPLQRRDVRSSLIRRVLLRGAACGTRARACGRDAPYRL